MSKRDAHKGLFDTLSDQGLLEYGSVIPRELVHDVLGIEVPTYAAKAVYDRLAMLELSAVDYCRNVLLGQGKYLMGTSSGYRVLLPSENSLQIDAYISSADRKLSRALKLSRSSPQRTTSQPDQTEARILMKRGSTRSIALQQ